MKIIKSLFFILFAIASSISTLCLNSLLYLIDIIDGGDIEHPPSTTENIIRYNHRTGDLDPVKRIDGLYDNE